MRASGLLTCSAFTSHSSLTELTSRYDGFILDQFGVLHNGKEALPGAVEAIEHLVEQKKRMIILSNTSSSEKSCLEKLQKLGFDPEWFQGGAVTSGEEASRFIRDELCQSAPEKAIWLTYQDSPLVPSPNLFLKKCGPNLQLADSVEEADFILAHGGEIWKQTDGQVSLGSFMKDGSFETLGPLLEECARRKLPMICANPDKIVKGAGGSTLCMPGMIAHYYEDQLNGDCTYFGKPQISHFKSSVEKLGLDATRVAHVGDSLHHDIKGANDFGVASVFVTSGIHMDDLGTNFGELPSNEKLQNLFRHNDRIEPTHVIPSFRI